MNCQKHNYKKDCLPQRQLQVLLTLRRLWFEHVMWTRSFIVSAAFNLPDLDPVTKRLLRNPTDFATVLKTLYGDYNAKVFEELFTDHLLIAAQLVNAAKEGNTASVNEQREIWYANATDIASFLAESNPYWNRKMWQEMLFEHLRITENLAVQILTGQYAMATDQSDLIEKQALQMADEMASGIFNQFVI